MRIALFVAGGGFAIEAFKALTEGHEVVAIVRPKRRFRRVRSMSGFVRRGWRGPPDELESRIRDSNVPSLYTRSGRDRSLIATLESKRPDLICIATFPMILDSAMLAVAPLGGINLHGSLLPRHRGPNPYFWTYFADDSESGVTVHVATNRPDAGDIIAQEAWPLERGMNVRDLHAQMASRGGRLLRQVVDRWSRGDRSAAPQDESLATKAPRPPTSVPMINYEEWPVERVWHFLSGVYPFYIEPLRCDGRPVKYRSVVGFEAREGTQPGKVEVGKDIWSLHCRGGVVVLR